MFPFSTAVVLTIVLAVVFALLWFIERTFFTNRLQSAGWRIQLFIAVVIILIVGSIGWVAYRSQGWPAVILVGITLLGCVANWIMEAIENKPENGDPQLDVYKLFRPMLVSPIVFAAVITALTGSTDPAAPAETTPGPMDFQALLNAIAPYVVAFQNGYFWQAILEREKPKNP